MKNLTISLPLDFDDEKTLSLYIPEPSFDRVEACLPVFRYVFKNRELFSDPLIACKDFDYLIKEALQDERVKLNFNAFIQEAVTNTKIVNDNELDDEYKNKSFQELYNDFDDDEKRLFKTILVFVYALLRYLPAKMQKKEASEFYTLLNYTDYKSFFLNSIEEVQKR